MRINRKLSRKQKRRSKQKRFCCWQSVAANWVPIKIDKFKEKATSSNTKYNVNRVGWRSKRARNLLTYKCSRARWEKLHRSKAIVLLLKTASTGENNKTIANQLVKGERKSCPGGMFAFEIVFFNIFYWNFFCT